MQYILTQEEMDNLTLKENVTSRDGTLEYCRKTILRLAGFKCVYPDKGEEAEEREVYCDDCPCRGVRHLCNMSKRCSK